MMARSAAAFVLVLVLLAPRLAPAADASRPNIVIIMADDMGFSDIGCYGGEIATPNLDALAKGGLRFTQFYNTARCCPTRAALLTGLYPHQAGIGHMMDDKGHDGYRGNLNDRCRTIAEVLRPAGYGTYMSGKWHVTRHIAPEGPKHNWPLQRGFDRFYGTIHGAGSFFDPNSLTLDNTQIPPDFDDYYYTDAITEHAARFIAEHDGKHGKDKPLFLYVAYTAPHWPMHARPADIAKYKGRYDAGWEALRKERHARQLEMGLLKPEWEMNPRDPDAPDWESLSETDRAWFARRMEVYAAMVDRMDVGIGRVVDALRKTGRLENTLILFLADNGGCAEEYGSSGAAKPAPGTPAAEHKPMTKDELQTRMQPTHARDGRPVRTGRGVMPGDADTYIAYGLPWANASNTPFRLYKHWVHEGGISSPLIAHWPAGIKPGLSDKMTHEPAHLIDLMATCVHLAGAKYPAEVEGRAITPMQGISLAPALKGEPLTRGRPIFWEHEGNRAVRDGKWKLVARGRQGTWQLYDIEADRTELHDLAAEQPDRVKAMAGQWEKWAAESMVTPWPEAAKPKAAAK